MVYESFYEETKNLLESLEQEIKGIFLEWMGFSSSDEIIHLNYYFARLQFKFAPLP